MGVVEEGYGACDLVESLGPPADTGRGLLPFDDGRGGRRSQIDDPACQSLPCTAAPWRPTHGWALAQFALSIVGSTSVCGNLTVLALARRKAVVSPKPSEYGDGERKDERYQADLRRAIRTQDGIALQRCRYV